MPGNAQRYGVNMCAGAHRTDLRDKIAREWMRNGWKAVCGDWRELPALIVSPPI